MKETNLIYIYRAYIHTFTEAVCTILLPIIVVQQLLHNNHYFATCYEQHYRTWRIYKAKNKIWKSILFHFPFQAPHIHTVCQLNTYMEIFILHLKNAKNKLFYKHSFASTLGHIWYWCIIFRGMFIYPISTPISILSCLSFLSFHHHQRCRRLCTISIHKWDIIWWKWRESCTISVHITLYQMWNRSIDLQLPHVKWAKIAFHNKTIAQKQLFQRQSRRVNIFCMHFKHDYKFGKRREYQSQTCGNFKRDNPFWVFDPLAVGFINRWSVSNEVLQSHWLKV